MRFVKMQGAGNDYVYVDCFAQPAPADPGDLSRRVSDRHFGVGGDGLVLIAPSEVADAQMRMFNADGSEAEMCGNAVRCVAKYVHDAGLARREELRVETGRGVLPIRVRTEAGVAVGATVDMGEPILESARIPTTLPGDPPIDVPLGIDDRRFNVTCVSMGNPHCVAFVDDAITDALVHVVGPRVEHHAAFPNRVNAEFVQVLSPNEVRMRVWERGSGETLACGTGAAAVAVAGVLSGRTAREVTVRLTGGDLHLHWSDADNRVYMTGPAVEVFRGDWPG